MADSDGIKKAVVLRSEEDFGGTPEFLSGSTKKSKKSKKKKKKQAAPLKPLEDAIFRQAKRFDEATTAYREAHEESNSKKNNGWIRDFAKNYSKGMSKLMKF